MTTIFGKIIKGELPAEKVFENERILAIKDLHPAAPVHLLIIPKKEIADLQSMQAEDLPILQEVVTVAQKLAKEFGIEKGYRLLTNIGPDAGQTIFHLHFHLIGGKPLSHLGLG
jgi:histidine triad (HIT) family protein